MYTYKKNNKNFKSIQMTPSSEALRIILFIAVLDLLLLFFGLLTSKSSLREIVLSIGDANRWTFYIEDYIWQAIYFLDGLILVLYGRYLVKRKKGEFLDPFYTGFFETDEQLYEVKNRYALIIGWFYIILGILLMTIGYLNFIK